jgi:hypothetical protein
MSNQPQQAGDEASKTPAPSEATPAPKIDVGDKSGVEKPAQKN